MSVGFERPSVKRGVLEYEEHLREKELEERRKRLGLPEPKSVRSVTGPREGLPPAPDEGDDGNGGWINAYEEILRSALKDLRVYSCGRRLHGGGEGWDGMPKPVPKPGEAGLQPQDTVYCMISVYRDAKRVFLSAYDPQVCLTECDGVGCRAL